MITYYKYNISSMRLERSGVHSYCREVPPRNEAEKIITINGNSVDVSFSADGSNIYFVGNLPTKRDITTLYDHISSSYKYYNYSEV